MAKSNLSFKNTILIKSTGIEVSLTGFIFKEDDTWVAYAPAVDVSSYGDSVEEAAEGLKDSVYLILEDLKETGRLEEDLRRLGWLLSAPSTAFSYTRPQPKKAPVPPAIGNDFYMKQMAMEFA